MFRRMIFACVAAVSLALGLTATAASASTAAVHPSAVHRLSQVLNVPDGVSPTTLITPAVAGYYTFNGFTYSDGSAELQMLGTPTSDATFADGTQLCNNVSGWTAGVGVLNNMDGTSFRVNVGVGMLPNNPSGDPCLSGVLPGGGQTIAPALLVVPNTHRVLLHVHLFPGHYFWVRGHWDADHDQWIHGHLGSTPEHALFQAEDLTLKINIWTKVLAFPAGVVNIFANEAGTGTQEPAACSTPLGDDTQVAAFTEVTANGDGYAGGTAVGVDALPASASIAELDHSSFPITPTTGTASSSWENETVGPLC